MPLDTRAMKRTGRMAVLPLAFALVLGGQLNASSDAKPDPVIPEKVYSGPVSELRILPASLALSDRFDARRVVVQGRTRGGVWVDLSQSASYAISDAAAAVVARDADGFFVPRRDGRVSVRVVANGQEASFDIVVSGADAPRPISYVRDIMPILGKAGCNSGSCHGGQKGKAGFKLSLRGYDPEWDHEQLIEDLASRRFNRSRPHDSLILLKPTNEVPHEGGHRFGQDSVYYRMLHQWIVDGNKSDIEKTTRAQRLEVLPTTPTLGEPGMTQDLVVIAHYADGSTRDVTRDAEYTSSRDIIAKVSPKGRIQALRRGETSIVVRYEGNYSVVDNVAVLGGARAAFVWTDPPANNYIDELVYAKLKKVQVVPSDLCTEAEFLRRVFIDLIGVPPNPEELRAFLADERPAADTRVEMIDKLLDRPEYVDRWAHKWADLLQCNRKYLGEKGAWAFRAWIRQAIARNLPIDQFVRELLTASGSSLARPATNYFRVSSDPQLATEATTQLFLATRFNCNKCHDHPFERWTQSEYYHFGAFFADVARKPGALPEEEVVYDRREGAPTVQHPRTKKVMEPRFPFQHAGRLDGANSRQKLAAWLTAPENPYFAKSLVNRFWSYFLGVGIIDPVDDIRSGNPPSNPQLLETLTKDFVAHKFDLKHLIRTIVNSRTYQLSFRTNATNAEDALNFSHALPRRLTAEQLSDAIAVALDVPAQFPGLPPGLRATQLPDTKVEADFLDQFGRPPRESVCECERVSEVSLKQTLSLINGPTIGDALANPNNRLARLIKEKKDDKDLVAEIYVAILCRSPTDLEVANGIEYMKDTVSRLEYAQDLAWALLNSPAFLFNR